MVPAGQDRKSSKAASRGGSASALTSRSRSWSTHVGLTRCSNSVSNSWPDVELGLPTTLRSRRQPTRASEAPSTTRSGMDGVIGGLKNKPFEEPTMAYLLPYSFLRRIPMTSPDASLMGKVQTPWVLQVVPAASHCLWLSQPTPQRWRSEMSQPNDRANASK